MSRWRWKMAKTQSVRSTWPSRITATPAMTCSGKSTWAIRRNQSTGISNITPGISRNESLPISGNESAATDRRTKSSPAQVTDRQVVFLLLVYRCLAHGSGMVESSGNLARKIIALGYHDPMQHAKKISDPEWRWPFLQNVDENKAVVKRWETVNKADALV
jgi:hypothetical protein